MGHRLFLCILGFGFQFLRVLGTEVTLRGSDFLSYSIIQRPVGSEENYISLKFKTIHPSGLLIYSRGTSDYIQLELIQGTLKYTSYLGGEGKTEICLGENLFNGKWHIVSVHRKGRKTELKINSQVKTKLTPGPYNQLNLNSYIFIGGLQKRRPRFRFRGMNFRGCLSDIDFDGTKILDGALAARPAYQLYGKVVFKCELQDYRPLSFLTPESYIKVTLPKLPQDNDTFSASFKFRTFHREGLLFSRSAIKVKLHVRLHSGVLLYDVIAPNGSKAELQLGKRLNDGEWHHVNATINPPNVRLVLDGRSRSTVLNITSLLLDFSNKSRLKIFAGRGGALSKFPGFVGCMLNLKIDSHKITVKRRPNQQRSRGVDTTKCVTKNHCFPNPCKNRGICSQEWNSFFCNCENTYFEGKTCEVRIFRPTCDHYRGLGLASDAHCLLDSDGTGPEDEYTALCNLTDPQRSYTVIKHNKQITTQVNTGEFEGGGYVHKIVYDEANRAQIAALIRGSKKCRQFTRFDCIKSRLFNSPGKTYVTWESRDGKSQTYWGGAIPGSNSCACGKGGIPSRCENPMKRCNCDIRDNRWRVDEGYLEEKELLPVMRILFDKRSAKSRFLLGPLECWGRIDKSKVTSSVEGLIKKTCHLVVEPPPSSTTTKKPTITTLTMPKICVDDIGFGVNCYGNSSSTTPTKSTGSSTGSTAYVTNVQGPQRGEDPADALSTPVIVVISCALIIIVLLMMKFVLPRIILCIRTHSKRGEYIVPPAATGYPGRLMPLVAKRSSSRGRFPYRLEDGKHLTHEANNMNGSGGTKSYWV